MLFGNILFTAATLCFKSKYKGEHTLQQMGGIILLRSYGLVVLMLTVVLFSSKVSAQCSKDTDCKGERICQEGSCVDPQTNNTPAVSVSVRSTNDEKEIKAKEDYERVKVALPDFDHEGDFLAYGRKMASGQMLGSFIDYKNYRIKKYKRHGVARLVLGSIFLAVSVPLITVAAIGEGEDGMVLSMWVLGPAFGITGLSVLISGIVRAALWPRMEEGMRSLEMASRQKETVVRRFAIAPIISRSSSTWGLAGVCYF